MVFPMAGHILNTSLVFLTIYGQCMTFYAHVMVTRFNLLYNELCFVVFYKYFYTQWFLVYTNISGCHMQLNRYVNLVWLPHQVQLTFYLDDKQVTRLMTSSAYHFYIDYKQITSIPYIQTTIKTQDTA